MYIHPFQMQINYVYLVLVVMVTLSVGEDIEEPFVTYLRRLLYVLSVRTKYAPWTILKYVKVSTLNLHVGSLVLEIDHSGP